VNAWILFECSSTTTRKKTYAQIDFRHDLALLLIGGFSQRYDKRRAPAQYVGPTAATNVLNHENVHMGSKRVRRCVAHSRYKPNGKSVKQTAFGCLACRVFLCKECHFSFHSQN
jgi:hypothetical protein